MIVQYSTEAASSGIYFNKAGIRCLDPNNNNIFGKSSMPSSRVSALLSIQLINAWIPLYRVTSRSIERVNFCIFVVMPSTTD